MNSLKDTIATDADRIFLDVNDFAESRTLKLGETVLQVDCILDEDVLEERKGYKTDEMDGVYTNAKVLFVRLADINCRPTYGQLLTIDGDDYLVTACREAMGLLEIHLEANES